MLRIYDLHILNRMNSPTASADGSLVIYRKLKIRHENVAKGIPWKGDRSTSQQKYRMQFK